MSWPYPGDGPLIRARRVAVAYRAALLDADPRACQEIDTRVTGWGETWALPRIVVFDPDQWLKPHEAANLAAIGIDSLRQLRRRGRIKGRLVGGHYEYQARDVWKLSSAGRGRGTAVTDTLPENGIIVPGEVCPECRARKEHKMDCSRRRTQQQG